MIRKFGQNQSFRLEPGGAEAEDNPLPVEPRPEFKPPRTAGYTLIALFFAAVASAFWIGVSAAYLWGYFGQSGLQALGLQQRALYSAVILFPPLLFFGIAAAFALAHRMGRMAESLQGATEHLFTIDEGAARTAVRLGRAVRHELDALNSGLDGAFGRLRALESALEKQIAALDEAGARTEVRGEAIASRLTQESQRIATVSDQLSEAASRAAETVAGRSAQLKSAIETAEGSLKMAAQSLDVQAAGFRAAIQAASEAPHTVALKLDEQAKKIEMVSDGALSRSEFVLARQEKHRAALSELLDKLREEGAQFEAALSEQCKGLETAIGALDGEAKRFEGVTGDAGRHLDQVMENAASRANQLAGAFAAEAERLKQTAESSNALLTGLIVNLSGAGSTAKTLIDETAEASNGLLANLMSNLGDAGSTAKAVIGETSAEARKGVENLSNQARAESEKLLRAAGELGAEASRLRELLTRTAEEVERHLVRLPTLAQGEAQRVRQMVQSETDQMLDLSARMLSTMHARAAQTSKMQTAEAANDPGEGDGLKGLARRLTQRPKRGADLRSSADKTWEMKALLAAVESGESTPRELAGGTAAAIGALQLALADMAVDLEAIDTHSATGNEDWRRYLSGDRAVFARRLAGAIDEGAVDRITALYRDDARFHEAANAYMSEFENLLAKAREGDGGGLLTSSLLSADTGKIYLAIAYALGRL